VTFQICLVEIDDIMSDSVDVASVRVKHVQFGIAAMMTELSCLVQSGVWLMTELSCLVQSGVWLMTELSCLVQSEVWMLQNVDAVSCCCAETKMKCHHCIAHCGSKNAPVYLIVTLPSLNHLLLCPSLSPITHGSSSSSSPSSL